MTSKEKVIILILFNDFLVLINFFIYFFLFHNAFALINFFVRLLYPPFSCYKLPLFVSALSNGIAPAFFVFIFCRLCAAPCQFYTIKAFIPILSTLYKKYCYFLFILSFHNSPVNSFIRKIIFYYNFI